MNKAKIEMMRNGNAVRAGSEVRAVNALSKKRVRVSKEEMNLLAAFFAARLSNRDYDRALNATPRKLATIAFGEAMDAFIVWKRESVKLEARGLPVESVAVAGEGVRS